MKIHCDCNSCGRSYAVKPELAGKQAKCKKCGPTICVPSAAPAATTPATPVLPAAQAPIEAEVIGGPSSAPVVDKSRLANKIAGALDAALNLVVGRSG